MESITLAADDEHQGLLLATPMPDTTELPAAPDAAGPRFQGDLLIFPRAEARILPTTASDGPPTPFILNLFADASFPMTKHHRGPSTPSQPAGAAVLWKPWPGLAGHDLWHSRAFQVLACRDFCEAEVFAVVAALETAALLSHLMPELRQVTVFTDCKDAIRKLIAAAENASDTLPPRTDKKQVSIWRDCEQVEAPQDDGIVTPQPATREVPPRKRQRTDEGPGPSGRHALLPKGTGMGVSVAGDQDGIVAGFIARSRETPPPTAAVNGAVERSEVADTSTQQIGASPNVSDSEEEDGNDTRSLTLGRSPEAGDEASLE
ncbi:putative reverse transcriptase [Colletotrichum higginsianum]|nr:putative reverse transcriptase [Colletotrichum higginsianum]